MAAPAYIERDDMSPTQSDQPTSLARAFWIRTTFFYVLQVSANQAFYNKLPFLHHKAVTDLRLGLWGAEVDKAFQGVAGELVMAYTVAALSMIAAAIWLLVDRRARGTPLVRELTILIARVTLAGILCHFGYRKVLDTQTVPPGPVEWIRYVADWHSTSIFWIGSGASPWFTQAAGWSELVACVLLLIPRTVVLGALLSAAILENINLILTTPDHTWFTITPGTRLIFACIILAFNWRRVVAFFFNRPTGQSRSFDWGSAAARRAIIAGSAVLFIFSGPYYWWQAPIQWYDRQSQSPIEGVYRVDRFSLNGQTTFTEAEAAKRWRIAAIESCTTILVRTVSDDTIAYRLMPTGRPVDFNHINRRCAEVTSAETGELAVLDNRARYDMAEAPSDAKRLRFTRTPKGLLLSGELGGAHIDADLRRIPSEKYGLYIPWWR
jgi:uncharacterized membrane protein YphA (DoxX/SURF4 family)